jgi:DNA-entry nuclease
VQPGIEIDYATGDSRVKETASSDEILPIVVDPPSEESKSITRSSENGSITEIEEKDTPSEEPEETTYILNTNTKKFHQPYCSSVQDIKDKNKRETTQSREEIISQGYQPCKRCNP